MGGEMTGLSEHQYDDMTFGDSTIRTDDVADEIARLYAICDMAMPRQEEQGAHMTPQELARRREQLDQTWEAIREWLTAHPSQDERLVAAQRVGHFSTTALHLVCKLADPPADVVESLVSCSPDVVTWPDSNGWLPLHHACANGASGEVLSILCESYPEGKKTQDRRQRTPLHFAFFRTELFLVAGDSDDSGGGPGGDSGGNTLEEVVALLGDTGAARLPDEGGMLPMHYACAYGTSTAVLEVLEEAFPESIALRENKGRTPLHLAMVNAHRWSKSPDVVKFLLEKGAKYKIVDITDHEGHLPLYLLAMASRVSKSSQEDSEAHSNASRCLRMYLDAGPQPVADFLSALQALPEWLRDAAVLSQHVQGVLNKKIIRRMPTFIVMMDGYMLLMMIICFTLSATHHIDWLHDDELPKKPKEYVTTVILTIVGGAYFLLREIIQAVAMSNRGTFTSWLYDAMNWLDMAVIFLAFFTGALMLGPPRNRDAFRIIVVVTTAFLYFDVLIYFKSLNVGFAVFVGGLSHVISRLRAFIICVGVLILCFAQMFNTIYTGTELCTINSETNLSLYPREGCYEDFPHCHLWRSLLKSFSMMMGEIGDDCRYGTYPQNETYPISLNWETASKTAEVTYVLYALLVVIVLSTVLIAVVTDSYSVVKNERAAMVFWANRLDFVVEMDAIANFCRMIFSSVGISLDGSSGAENTEIQETPTGVGIPVAVGATGADKKEKKDRFQRAWADMVGLFDPSLLSENEVHINSVEFWFYQFFRLVAIVIIPIWFLLGVATAGLLWPAQISEWLFARKWLFAQNQGQPEARDRIQIIQQDIDQLRKEVKSLRVDFKKEREYDQKELSSMKVEVDSVQQEVLSDIAQVKEIMTTLFELNREKARQRLHQPYS